MPTVKTGDQKARSNLPAPAPLAGQARATPLLPSRSFRPWAPLGSARLSSAALASPSAVSGAVAESCGDAPRAGCRCRTGRQLRGRPSGAPQLAEGRRAASGTDGEWRRARRQPQVRRARALGGWVPLGPGPHTSRDPCPHRHGAHGRARGRFLLRLEMSWFQSRFLSRRTRVGSPAPSAAPLWHQSGSASHPIPAVLTPAPVFGSPRDPTSVPYACLSARS